MSMKTTFNVFKQTFKDWSQDKAARLAAALAYYTIFSIAPLLVILIAVLGLVLGRQAVQGQIMGQIQGLIGGSAAGLIQDMIRNASQPRTGIIATVIGIVTLLIGAMGVFGQLQDSLNTIWGVMPGSGRSIWAVARDRLLNFAMVLGIGFVLVVSLVVSAAISALSGVVSRFVPGVPFIWQAVNQVVSFGVVTLLFALMYKVLPDAEISWKDVWVGAAVTGLLFTIGKYLIGLYLGRSSVSSAYGAAGSLVVILLWIYYSAQILFFGAEFTKVYARRFGARIVPARGAVLLTPEARADQGIPTREQLEEAARRERQAPIPQRGGAGAGPARAGMHVLAATQPAAGQAAARIRGAAAAAAGAVIFTALLVFRTSQRRS
jgi:membrane protein